MKKYITICGKCWLMMLLAACMLYSCQNDDYLEDGGICSPYYDGSIIQFLESRPDLFTDLVEVIRYAGLESVLNEEEVTFFAPTDFSIENSVNRMNESLWRYGKDKVTDLHQIKPEVWRDIISMYIMKGKYALKDIAQLDTLALSSFSGQTNYTYFRNYKMRMGVVYGDAAGIKYAGARQILYSYPDYDVNAYVATCNIEPRNGLVHVLHYGHYLAFSWSLMYRKAEDAGIDYAWKEEEDNDLLKKE